MKYENAVVFLLTLIVVMLIICAAQLQYLTVRKHANTAGIPNTIRESIRDELREQRLRQIIRNALSHPCESEALHGAGENGI